MLYTLCMSISSSLVLECTSACKSVEVWYSFIGWHSLRSRTRAHAQCVKKEKMCALVFWRFWTRDSRSSAERCVRVDDEEATVVRTHHACIHFYLIITVDVSESVCFFIYSFICHCVSSICCAVCWTAFIFAIIIMCVRLDGGDSGNPYAAFDWDRTQSHSWLCAKK